MFTEKCFIRKNTQELQDKLLNLSLKRNTLDDFKGNCLAVNYGIFISQYRLNELKEYEHNEDIDCGENEELFLAIAALRDNTDKYQCITNGKIFMTCEKDDINEFVAIIYDGYHFENEEERKDALSNRWHKLTVQELIEHFK